MDAFEEWVSSDRGLDEAMSALQHMSAELARLPSPSWPWSSDDACASCDLFVRAHKAIACIQDRMEAQPVFDEHWERWRHQIKVVAAATRAQVTRLFSPSTDVFEARCRLFVSGLSTCVPTALSEAECSAALLVLGQARRQMLLCMSGMSDGACVQGSPSSHPRLHHLFSRCRILVDCLPKVELTEETLQVLDACRAQVFTNMQEIWDRRQRLEKARRWREQHQAVREESLKAVRELAPGNAILFSMIDDQAIVAEATRRGAVIKYINVRVSCRHTGAGLEALGTMMWNLGFDIVAVSTDEGVELRAPACHIGIFVEQCLEWWDKSARRTIVGCQDEEHGLGEYGQTAWLVTAPLE
jgi:hypothetical protein